MRLLITLLFCLPLHAAFAQAALETRSPGFSQRASPPATQATTPRPKVALVLSGGGARGLAHVGVLKVLDELQVPLDVIVGTSMGAVVGGAYASGRSVEELEKIVAQLQWDEVLATRPPRDQLSLRRREEDLLIPSRIQFGISLHGVELPSAVAGSNKLDLTLAQLLPADRADLPGKKLPIPFASVATDLLTGELVEMSGQPVLAALRSSLSIPGVFLPARVDGRLLIDGGLVRNLPVDLARAMGAEIVIAVNLGTSLAPEKELNSAVGIAQQMINILTEQNVQQSIRELKPQDILISPDLGEITFLDFSQPSKAIEAGVTAANQPGIRERLLALAIPPGQYLQWQNARLNQSLSDDPSVPLAAVRINGTQRTNADTLIAQTGLEIGQPVNKTQIAKAVDRLYGQGDFDRITPSFKDTNNQREVNFDVQEAPWTYSRLRLALELKGDFSDNNNFTLSAMHVLPWVNAWNGEVRTMARVGQNTELSTELWQPLGPGEPWFVAPAVKYEEHSKNLYAPSGLRLARYSQRETSATLALGRQMAQWGDVRIGVQRGYQDNRLLVPEDLQHRPLQAWFTSQFLELRADTLDTVAFPTQGLYANARVARVKVFDESDLGVSAQVIKPFKFRDWAGQLYAQTARTQKGLSSESLGGFLRLSGVPEDALFGNKVALGRAMLARQVGSGWGGALRVGFSAEWGAAVAQNETLNSKQFIAAGSAFLAFDTLFGPLYLAVGKAEGFSPKAYLFLGPIW